MPTKAVARAIEHMTSGGELRIYVDAGPLCRRPPKVGSGVIVSDIGRIEVSRLTVSRLREIGTKRHYRNYKYGPTHEQDAFEAWETM
jgi:hypothetical protein